jgi:hypothetical protein
MTDAVVIDADATSLAPHFQFSIFNFQLDCGDNQTSFLPNFDNKTTSVAGECAYNQPHYLIKTHDKQGNNEVMRSLDMCCLRATEVVLLSKLGENEVFSDVDDWTTTMADEYRTRRDARTPGVSTWTWTTTMAVEHRTCRYARTPGVSTWTSGTLGTSVTLGSQSPKDFNLDNPLQAEGAARGCGSEIEESRRNSKEIEESRKKLEKNRKKIRAWKSCIFNFQLELETNNNK